MVSDLYDLIFNSSIQVLVFLSVLSRGFSRDAHAQFEHGSSATCRDDDSGRTRETQTGFTQVDILF